MKVLVVVDMQNDFVSGSLGTPEAQAIVPKVKRKIEEYRENGDLVCFTLDTHSGDYLETREGKKLPVKHCIYPTWGFQIVDELCDGSEALIVNKHTFGSEKLVELLKEERECRIENDYMYTNIDEIELVGLCTDICVVSNALMLKAAFYNDCEISVDANCCAGTTPEMHEAALKVMESCQINVKR